MDHTHATISTGWEPGLVLLSYAIAVFASYIALGLAGRVTKVGGPARRLWLCIGGFVMGAGIWAMHFTGMLAFHTSIPLSYDVPLTVASLLVAVVAQGWRSLSPAARSSERDCCSPEGSSWVLA